MTGGVDFFGNPNQWATDYGRAQHQAEREAEEAKRQAREWQAHAKELEAAYNAMKAQRDEQLIAGGAWKEVVRELASRGAVTKEEASLIFERKKVEVQKKLQG